MVRRGLIGAVLGVASLVCGVVVFAGQGADRGWALLAGVLGALAGAVALGTELNAVSGRLADMATVREQPTSDVRVASPPLASPAPTAAPDFARASALVGERSAPGGRDPREDDPHAVGGVEIPADLHTLTDPGSDLFSEGYFRVTLDSRIAAARRHLRPLAVALVEPVTAVGTGHPVPVDPVEVADCLRETLRDADTPCRMLDGVFAVILEDTPENGAVWTIERIRRSLASRFEDVTLWAGIACYPAHAFSTEELLEQSRLALSAAREWRQDRIEVATAD